MSKTLKIVLIAIGAFIILCGGAFNTLRLECAGDTCAFFVNEEVTALVEAAAERDAIGVMAWRYSEEVLQIEVEYLRVWAQAG